MLNYIWAGLIVFSLAFALISDFIDISRDTYRNEQPLPIQLRFPEGYQPQTRLVDAEILIDPATYAGFYDTEERPDSVYQGVLVQTQRGRQLRFSADATLPAPLTTIREFSSSGDDELQGTIANFEPGLDSLTYQASIVFAPVRFPKINAITGAAFDFAETAATIALGLIGVLALFLGLLKIAEASGIINALVRVTQPLFRPLFPEIPDGHPAMGMIVLNLTANMLGLGNAATPLGIKAMEELQNLSPEKDTATNSMVMLLALNTASIQLVPPTLLVAIMGLQVNELIFPIITVTIFSAIVAVLAARWLGRMKRYRATDPNRLLSAPPAKDTAIES